MLADIGKALLDNPIDMRCRRRRQALEVAIDRKRDLQFSGCSPFLLPGEIGKAGSEPEVVDLRRAEGPQGRTQRSHHGHRCLREIACLGHERGALGLGRRLDRRGDRTHGAQGLCEFIVKLARQIGDALVPGRRRAGRPAPFVSRVVRSRLAASVLKTSLMR